ncbi:Down syndrome cell adhesion molecule-like protein Dscam2 [Leptotrombidium deliense]|uniref:Down syndrome cell adhesion molecule-like protein Dscam2 n=1 Tax=Leptotrombidium deliense TaxID=299467 RepID=A0A443S9S5_9ACAR|nr:Down syndrome cell adhesion molecule-like protein Dscam2 [Leptotrombidium deliense]
MNFDQQDISWPVFAEEPPNKVTFYNSTGAVIACIANGKPQPSIHWITVDTNSFKFDHLLAHKFNPIFSAVKDVPGLRHTRPDGSLLFSPFSGDQYSEAIHSRIYRCVASNNHGTVVSRNVQIKGDLLRLITVSLRRQY